MDTPGAPLRIAGALGQFAVDDGPVGASGFPGPLSVAFRLSNGLKAGAVPGNGFNADAAAVDRPDLQS